uniref:Uncharacterized protein n=1 Tax=Candidatus Methanogaster sp. ANME-2c ERB4 TaxID=2759911 RepID=A0A7G9YEI2_9EURY|nr:hypothetical protein NIBJONLA_00033 [Methanosarcinales archaeon ANME-2c ERB4]
MSGSTKTPSAASHLRVALGSAAPCPLPPAACTRQPAPSPLSHFHAPRRRIRPRHDARCPAARLACGEARRARIGGGEDQGCNWQMRAVHECVKSTLTGVSFFGVECCACKMSMYSFVLECEVRRLKGDDIFLDKETFISLKDNYISHEWL